MTFFAWAQLNAQNDRPVHYGFDLWAGVHLTGLYSPLKQGEVHTLGIVEYELDSYASATSWQIGLARSIPPEGWFYFAPGVTLENLQGTFKAREITRARPGGLTPQDFDRMGTVNFSNYYLNTQLFLGWKFLRGTSLELAPFLRTQLLSTSDWDQNLVITFQNTEPVQTLYRRVRSEDWNLLGLQAGLSLGMVQTVFLGKAERPLRFRLNYGLWSSPLDRGLKLSTRTLLASVGLGISRRR